MKQSGKKYLIKTDEISKRIIDILSVVLFCLLIFLIIDAIVSNNFDFYKSIFERTQLKTMYKYTMSCLFLVWLLLVSFRAILSLFVKEEDEEEDEAENKDEESKIEIKPTDISSPLRELSPEEEKIVIDMLRNLPPHISDSDRINMAVMSQYLTALVELGYLKDDDKSLVRQWVIQISDKQVPNVSQFNEAFPSTNIAKVNKAQQNIQKELSKIR